MALIFKQGDTHNAITSFLDKNGEPVNLRDCQVYITVEGLVYKDDCMILDSGLGKVSYLVSNISHESGFFNYEYIVKYLDGTEEIYPNDGYGKVRIYKGVEGVIK